MSQTVVITSPLRASEAPGPTAGVCLGSVRRHCPAANTPSRMSKIDKAPAILHTARLHQGPTSCPALPLPDPGIYSPQQLWSSLTTSACWGVWRRTSPQGHSAAQGLQPPDLETWHQLGESNHLRSRCDLRLPAIPECLRTAPVFCFWVKRRDRPEWQLWVP